MTATLLYKSECILGEGPIWHSERESFFWVDIEGKAFHEYEWKTGIVKRWHLNHMVSLIVQHTDKTKLLLGLQGGLASFDIETATMKWLVDIEKDITANRTNDGGCDAAGRIWLGT